MMARGQVPWHRHLVFWAIALCGAGFDLATKRLVFDRLPLGARQPVFDGILELHPIHNTGALWGLGAGLPYSGLVFALFSLAAAAAIYYYLFVRRAARDWRLTTALGLIMAGALGNCHDRLMHGYVRDFIHFHVDTIRFNFAIFNVADSMLVIGACALLLLALRPEIEAGSRAGPGEQATRTAAAAAGQPGATSDEGGVPVVESARPQPAAPLGVSQKC
jgi:signal peptidase II